MVCVRVYWVAPPPFSVHCPIAPNIPLGAIAKQEAQGLGALLDKMEGNDHIKLDNTEV